MLSSGSSSYCPGTYHPSPHFVSYDQLSPSHRCLIITSLSLPIVNLNPLRKMILIQDGGRLCRLNWQLLNRTKHGFYAPYHRENKPLEANGCKRLNTTLMAQSKDTKRTLLPKDIHKWKVLTILKPFPRSQIGHPQMLLYRESKPLGPKLLPLDHHLDGSIINFIISRRI